MLHFAPEAIFVKKWQELEHLEYVTSDLYDPKASVCADICQMPFHDEYFDVLYCSHVLEHVTDDHAAMRECYRVLKQNGWAVFLVPIGPDPTIEDPTVNDPKERERRFGQNDHVRLYGPDFVERLEKAGFVVTQFKVEDVIGVNAHRYAIPANESPLFFCQKRMSNR